jgi:hypothetical protein
VKDGSVHLSLHAGQIEAWKSTSRYTYILAGTQSGKCLALGSRVLLADGTLKAIEDVRPGDVVLSLNETTLRIEPNTVSASFPTGVQPVFRFTLASGRRLDVTSVHPLYGPYGWKPAAEFGVGDRIGVPPRIPQEDNPDSDIYWDAVEKIEPLGEQPVWDITVENGHNFIANDIFAHNTTYLPWVGARNILQTCDPEGGNNDFLAVTATFDLFRLKFLPAMREVLEQALGIGRYWPSNKVIELRDPRTGQFWARRMDDPMWGRVILRAASSPGGLESATARGAILDEFGQDTFTAEAMEALDRRLSLIGGWIVGGTTPYTAFGWIRERVVTPARRIGSATEQPGDKDVCLIQFDSCTNPAFSAEEFERARRSMPAWRFDLFYRGKLSRPAGQIFSCFRDRDVRDAGHRCKVFPVPSRWLRVLGIDFGTTNTAGVIGAVEEDGSGYPTGRLIAMTSYVGAGRHASEHAGHIQTLAGDSEITFAVGGAPSEDGWRQGYLHAGLPVHQPTERDVEVRIDKCFGTIKTGRLLVFETLRGTANGKGLIDQVLDYSRELDALGNPSDKIKDKAKYHLVDALGYLTIGMGALTGMARRFLPFDPRKHWANLPTKEQTVKPETWWPRFGGLVWKPNGAAAFLLGCTDPSGALHVEGEVIRSGVSEGDMASAIKALIQKKRGDGPSVPIVGNAELFADLPTQGGGLVGESAASAFMRAGLSLIPADSDGTSEWAELRDRLEASGARGITIDRSACPSAALALMLIEPDALEPGKPAKHSPIEPGLALCHLLLLRPEAARKSEGAALVAELNKHRAEFGQEGDAPIDPEAANPELLKLLTKK